MISVSPPFFYFWIPRTRTLVRVLLAVELSTSVSPLETAACSSWCCTQLLLFCCCCSCCFSPELAPNLTVGSYYCKNNTVRNEHLRLFCSYSYMLLKYCRSNNSVRTCTYTSGTAAVRTVVVAVVLVRTIRCVCVCSSHLTVIISTRRQPTPAHPVPVLVLHHSIDTYKLCGLYVVQ